MLVYHASTELVETPDVNHSRKFLDFGQGFYVTSMREQAEKYAARFIRANGSAVVNEYELDDCWRDEHKVKVFEAYDEEWLDFVVANRNGDDVECFDAVEGGIADDKVFETVDLYLEGLINKNEALNRLVFEKPNHQICFLNQKVIDDNLKFVKGTKI